jgi:hypothetical protein
VNSIPWYRSTVLVSAVASIVFQVLTLLGKADAFPPEVVTGAVESVFQVIALVAAGIAALARMRSKVLPLVLLAGCTGTRAAYSAAAKAEHVERLEATAYVVAEHYAAVRQEAARMRTTGQLTGAALAAVQAADKAVEPLVLGDPASGRAGVVQLVETWRALKTAETEADLQAAVNAAVVRLSELINAMKASR